MAFLPRKRHFRIRSDSDDRLDVIANKKPLGYDSLKTVLMYMDANERFKIYQRLPSIRKTERVVPLHIKTLILDEMSITINGVKYQLGVYREFHNGHISTLEIKKDNDSGGTPYDLDKFGFRDDTPAYAVTPGDIRLNKIQKDPIPTKKENKVILDRARHKLKALELSRNSSFDKESRIVELESMIFSMEYQERNEHPPYDSYIQLTIHTQPATIKRTSYNMKLPRALKVLTSTFFDGRRVPISVNKLELDGSLETLRLPTNLQFKVTQLTIRERVEETLRGLAPIIQSTSLPLIYLSLYGQLLKPEELNNDLVQNAQKICIDCKFLQMDRIYNVLPKNVEIMEGYAVGSLWYTTLIKHWLEVHPAIGTRFSGGYHDKGQPYRVIDYIKEEFNVGSKGLRSISIPINLVTEVMVTCEAVDPELRRWNPMDVSYKLVIKVQRARR